MNSENARISLKLPARKALYAVLLASLVGLAACGGKPAANEAADADKDKDKNETAQVDDKKPVADKKEPKPVPVEVAPVGRRSIESSYAGTASLQAPEEAQVVAKTSGVLLDLRTEEGQFVRKGQVIAQIDPDRTRLEVARAEATLRKLEAEFNRSTELFERKLVAAEAHERLRFDVETQRAAWNLVKLELSYTQVVAPISGVVAERMVKVGNLIQLNQPMFRIVNTERLEAVLNVPERELSTMKPGLSVNLGVDALPGARFAGTIDRVSPVVDSATGTFRVTATFTDEAGRLMPGMFGRVSVIYDRRADSLAVPRIALLEEEVEPAVYVVSDDKVVRTPIVLGYVNGEFAEVMHGLSEGDQVVTAGKVAVRDGTKVQIIVPSSALAQANANAIAGAASR